METTSLQDDDDIRPTFGKLKVACFNIANANRDEAQTPLAGRLDAVCETIRSLNCDVICLLEAGRPTRSLSWTDCASIIEKETGLTYYGVFKPLPPTPEREYPLSKAIFYNVRRVFLKDVKQLYVPNKNDHQHDFKHNGNTVVVVTTIPLNDVKKKTLGGIVPDESSFVKIGFSHFPMGREDRMHTARWLTRHASEWSFLMGDMNTFPDDGGPEMISTLNYAYEELLPSDTPFTFKAFEHDLVNVGIDVPLNKESIVVSKTDTHKCVRFSSWLDHAFASKNQSSYPREASARLAKEMVEGISDHWPVLLEITIE